MPRARRPGPPSRIPMPGTNRSRRPPDGRARAGWTRPRFPPTIILRSRIMADRVSASITIGGALLSALLPDFIARSEEHTSELQSLMRISYAVFCLKKKNNEKYQRRDNNDRR